MSETAKMSDRDETFFKRMLLEFQLVRDKIRGVETRLEAEMRGVESRLEAKMDAKFDQVFQILRAHDAQFALIRKEFDLVHREIGNIHRRLDNHEMRLEQHSLRLQDIEDKLD